MPTRQMVTPERRRGAGNSAPALSRWSGHGDELECLGGVAGGAGPLLELRAVGRRAVGDVQAFVAAVAGGEGVGAVGLQRGQPLLVGAAASAPQLDRGPVA